MIYTAKERVPRLVRARQTIRSQIVPKFLICKPQPSFRIIASLPAFDEFITTAGEDSRKYREVIQITPDGVEQALLLMEDKDSQTLKSMVLNSPTSPLMKSQVSRSFPANIQVRYIVSHDSRDEGHFEPGQATLQKGS